MARKGFTNAKTGQITRRMSRNGYIIIINQQFHIEVVSNSKPCRFSIITFLLGTIGAQAKKCFTRVRQRHTVNIGPHMS